ncbi:MAG: SDR family NAD(P)-dependent oxidoreductase [Deltaproteobacteria bacterium]|nr:SDR family NAD(P)-dependent oxidoreductase [Deltaproteobacteria bacterium]
MRVVVTGGAGFIGSHLAERLVARGHEVVIYDSFAKQYAEALKRRNVAAALALPGCTLIEGDILEAQRLDSAFSGHAVDVVVHLAATIGTPASASVKSIVEANVLGTHNVLDACRRHNTARLVLVSSSVVYGAGASGPCRELDATDRQLSVYAATKKMAETLAWLAHHQHGLNVWVVRPFSVYGPRQRPDQVLYRCARAVMAGEPAELPGDGSATLDAIYIDDAVEAIALAAEAVKGHEVLNVGTGRGTTMRELVARLGVVLGLSPDVRPGPPDPALPAHSVADTETAQRLLGWRAAIDLDEGLRRFANWVRAEEFADEA